MRVGSCNYAPPHELPWAGTLDELESLLSAMERRGLDTGNARYDPWRMGICRKRLMPCLLEMRLYIHFLLVDKNLELEPPIGNGKLADLKVFDMYVEAFVPHDATSTAFRRMQFTNSRCALASKIRNKRQVCSFGGRRSVIVVEDPHDYVDNSEFQSMLAAKITVLPQLAAVFIIRDIGRHYRRAVVRNPEAAMGIAPEMEQTVMWALGTPCM